MSSILSRQAYNETDFNIEGKFIINEEFVSKILLDTVLCTAKKIGNQVHNFLHTLGFKYAETIENTNLQDNIVTTLSSKLNIEEETAYQFQSQEDAVRVSKFLSSVDQTNIERISNYLVRICNDIMKRDEVAKDAKILNFSTDSLEKLF